MYTFISSILLLIVGYLIYGSVVEKVFGSDPARKTPCYTSQDGVDYMPMPTWKVFLIQFLNIAGTGPIFGAIQGILFGPAAYMWIVLGCVFGGAVHDFMSGMISLRKNGASLPELVGDELGSIARIAMRVMALILMILVGAVFVTTPAGLLASICGGNELFGQALVWTIIIFAYYVLATLLPIDKLIGKIYPVFGVALLIMALGVGFGIFYYNGSMPEITEAFTNHHPHSAIPIFPGLCITIACGAVSGFHATQSPMMARCMENEKYGRPVFYGAMITEGLVALIWAAAAIKFADSFDVSKFGMDAGANPYEKLWAIMTNGGTANPNPAILVNSICSSWLGTIGSILAILGVVAAPVTSGDTAFRSARLIAADFMHYSQNKIYKRLILSVPIFIISGVLMFIKFDVLWRYFAWFNQTLSIFTLWAVSVWLYKHCKKYTDIKRFGYIMTVIPAMWMTAVCTSYILVAPEGFCISGTEYAGFIAALICLVAFICWARRVKSEEWRVKSEEVRVKSEE